MLCFETQLILCLVEGVLYRIEFLVVGNFFDKRLDFLQTCFNVIQILAGAVIETVNDHNLRLRIGVLEQIVFRDGDCISDPNEST